MINSFRLQYSPHSGDQRKKCEKCTYSFAWAKQHWPRSLCELLFFLTNRWPYTTVTGAAEPVLHQAIIKKIADERRRRAQDIRQSWSEGGPTDPAQPQPSSSTEVSTSGGIQSDPLAVYSSTSQSSLQQQKHHNASLSNAPTPSSTGVQSSSNSFRDSGNRRTAWEQNNVPESPLGNYETPSNKFPFPTNNGRGGDGRRVDSADRDNLASSTPSSRDVGGGGSRRDGTRWTAELATRTPSHATGRGGIGGVTGGGGGGGDNGDRYHPTPSSNRLASVGDTNTGEEEAAGGRYGDRRRGQGKSNPGGLPTRKSAIDPTIGAGTTRTSRVASPLSRGQHHGSGAVPPEDVLGIVNVVAAVVPAWLAIAIV